MKNKNYLLIKIAVNFILFTCFIFISEVSAQSYYYLISHGVTDEFDMSAPVGNIILNAPANDVLSEVQALPFEWSFYGTPVTHFKASDNGYITFDTSQTSGFSSNTALPNSAVPNYAIYAFWDNIELSNNPSFNTNDIKTYTVGSSPNRIFVIQWHATPLGQLGNGNYLFFAIRIYEQGNFDIIFQQLRLNAGVTISATVGCENSDGTDASMVEGSPDFTYTGGVYQKENVPVYTFYYGPQISHDVSFAKVNIPEIAGNNKTFNFKGTIINHGTESINTLTIDYQIDDKSVQSSTINGLNIATNETYEFTHPISWQPEKVNGFENVKLWIENINGVEDENHSDDTLSGTTFVNLGIKGNKKVFIEEFSTCPCGFCPDGHIVLKDIMDRYPDVIGMIHHAGFGTDSMTIPESITIANAFTHGAPTATVDRIHWPNNIDLAISRQIWEEKALECLEMNTPVEMELNYNFDPSSRKLDVTIIAEFNDFPYPRDIRLNLYIIEDSVSGLGKGWDQTNYYNTTVGHPLFGKGDPIVGYQHMHVVRSIPTGAWGDNSVFPINISPGNNFEKSYTYTIPDRYKVKDMSIIAYVSNYSGERRDILNSVHQKITPVTDVEDNEVQLNNPEVIPNPVENDVIIKYYIDKPQNVKISIFNNLGLEVQSFYNNNVSAGINVQQLNFENLNSGIYFIKLQTHNTQKTEKIILMK